MTLAFAMATQCEDKVPGGLQKNLDEIKSKSVVETNQNLQDLNSEMITIKTEALADEEPELEPPSGHSSLPRIVTRPTMLAKPLNEGQHPKKRKLALFERLREKAAKADEEASKAMKASEEPEVKSSDDLPQDLSVKRRDQSSQTERNKSKNNQVIKNKGKNQNKSKLANSDIIINNLPDDNGDSSTTGDNSNNGDEQVAAEEENEDVPKTNAMLRGPGDNSLTGVNSVVNRNLMAALLMKPGAGPPAMELATQGALREFYLKTLVRLLVTTKQLYTIRRKMVESNSGSASNKEENGDKSEQQKLVRACIGNSNLTPQNLRVQVLIKI